MKDASLFALQSQDVEGQDLDALLCNKCTLGCNVIRIMRRCGEVLVLCGKKEGTQEILNAQRARLGIPEPGATA